MDAVTLAANAIYLSPHLDDVVLSCGGLIHRQIRGGKRVLLVTIFAGQPAQPLLSPFAIHLHDEWGLQANPVAARRKEDEEATRLLGAECVHLDYPDAIYRSDGSRFLYRSEEDLFGSLHPSDLALLPLISDDLAEVHARLRATIYAPLAVGRHVDHQLVREAALLLDHNGCALVFYEDYPYAEVPGAITAELSRIGVHSFTEELQELDEEDLEVKIQATAAYASQMVILFGGAETVAQRLRDYALALSPGQGPAERYWRLSGDANSGMALS
jgi:LmbE family N-acetylglucosaminyl deacetylase